MRRYQPDWTGEMKLRSDIGKAYGKAHRRLLIRNYGWMLLAGTWQLGKKEV
jgi:hypothetical protein